MTELETRVQDVIKLLKDEGHYRPRPIPLHIADVDYAFTFDAILEGPSTEQNLLLVCVAEGLPIAALDRRIQSLSVALRRSGSTRPITLLLIQSQPDKEAVARLELQCRVIPVTLKDDLRLSLAPLLPLPLTIESQTLTAAIDALRHELGNDQSSTLTSTLIEAARGESSGVEKVVLAAIRRAATVTDTEKKP